LAAAGIVLAHMANNLMNDLFDLEVGTDRVDYPRNLYSPHPVLSGVITRKGLAACALVVKQCASPSWSYSPWPAAGRSSVSRSAGSCCRRHTPHRPYASRSAASASRPCSWLWGPLMVGGTYYAATGTIPGAVVLASLP